MTDNLFRAKRADTLSLLGKKEESPEEKSEISRSISEASSDDLTAKRRVTYFSELYSPLREISNLMNIFFVEVFLYLIAAIFFSLCMIERYRDNATKIGPLFFVFSCYHFLKICIYFLYTVLYKKIYSLFKLVFFYGFANSLGYLVIYFGLFLYMQNKISKNDLWLFVMPHLTGLAIMNFIKFEGQVLSFVNKYRINQLFLLEAVQNLFIAINLAFLDVDWEWATILYEIYYLLWFFFVTIMVVIAFMLIVYWIYVHKFSFFYFVIGFYTSALAFFFIYMGFFAYFIYNGFRKMMDAGLLDPANRGGPIHPTIYHVSVYLVFFASINLIWLVIGLILLKLFVFKFGPSEKEKLAKIQVLIDFFFININLEPEKTSGSLKHQDEDARPLVDRNNEIRLCYVCQTEKTNVILKPCDHTGICSKCFRQSVKQQPICPICKQKVTRYYTFAFNEEQQTFVPTDVIKIEE